MIGRIHKVLVWRTAAAVLCFELAAAMVPGQTAGPASAAAADPALDMAQNLVGKALILRGFYAASDLNYDAEGRIQGAPKVEDWTLCGVNIGTARRKGAHEIDLDGVRVAIKYNQEAHQFERHPQKNEAVHISIATTTPVSAGPAGADDAAILQRAFAAIFSVGIDPALQRAVPTFWQHYFDTGLAWGKDELSDVRIVTPGQTGPGAPTAEEMKSFVNPVAEHRENAKFTDLAVRDKVTGEIELKMVVDAEGIPRRIAIVRPIGYGLDARAVETVAKWRFRPGTLEGKPVAATIIVREQFDVPATGHP